MSDQPKYAIITANVDGEGISTEILARLVRAFPSVMALPSRPDAALVLRVELPLPEMASTVECDACCARTPNVDAGFCDVCLDPS